MPYVRNAWYVAAWTPDLPAGKPVAVTILGERVVLFRPEEGGAPVALEDRCVHRLAPLSLGRCEGANLRCMYHGLLFAPDGRVVEIPGQDTIPPQARVRAYPVVERHSWVWLWMGDAAAADPALVPPAVGLDDPDWTLGHGHLDYRAEARLINDNLLDLSHLSYVHAASFGAGPEFAQRPARVLPIGRGVRVERWLPGVKGSSVRRSTEPVDSFQSYDFLLPGVLLMWSANYPVGTAERLAHAAPRPEDATANLNFTSQAVTPMTDRTARYFFSWGPHRRHGDEGVRDGMMRMAGLAFAEDKAMIEAQQQVIDATPDPRVMPTAHDRGVTLFNRLVERLARGEPVRRAA